MDEDKDNTMLPECPHATIVDSVSSPSSEKPAHVTVVDNGDGTETKTVVESLPLGMRTTSTTFKVSDESTASAYDKVVTTATWEGRGTTTHTYSIKPDGSVTEVWEASETINEVAGYVHADGKRSGKAVSGAALAALVALGEEGATE